MSLGFEQAGFDVLVAVDNDPVHLATHQYNFPKTSTLCQDVATLDTQELFEAASAAAEALPHRGRVADNLDCVFGGPSCQGFSSIGRRNPSDPRNTLLGQFARVVEDLSPRSFVMENVPGLLAPSYERTLKNLLARFDAAGYVLANHGRPLVLDAADFGVPQRRKRVFIVGVRDNEVLPEVPKELEERVSVCDALADLPNVDGFEALLKQDWVSLSISQQRRMEKTASAYARRMRLSSDGFAYPRLWDPTLLTSSGRTVHTPAVVKRFKDTPPGSEEIVSRNPRLNPTAQSTTLRAGTGRDHGSFSAARPIHYDYPRVITVREAARLHSFPDWFRLHVTKWHGFRQVGNSVPPLLARAVAQSVVGALGSSPSEGSRIELGDPALLEMSLHEAADHFGYARSLLPKDSRLLGGSGKRNARRES